MALYKVGISSSSSYLRFNNCLTALKWPYGYRPLKYKAAMLISNSFISNNLFDYFNERHKHIPKKMKK